jgi:hypothetical protein
MATVTNALMNLQVASPCSASWDQMQGGDKVRFCADCHLHVYNLSAMTRVEAEALLQEREALPCVRFYQRRDGTVLTQDCPRHLEAVRRSARPAVGVLVGVVVGMFFLLLTVLLAVTGSEPPGNGNFSIHQIEPFQTIETWLGIAPPPPPCIMGIPAPPKPNPDPPNATQVN